MHAMHGGSAQPVKSFLLITQVYPKRGKAPILALDQMCHAAHGHPGVFLLVPVRVSAAGDGFANVL